MNMDKALYKLLNEIGIPASLLGHRYLAEAIKDVYATDSVPAMSALYRRIAYAYGSTETKVERAIRFAIEHTFSNTDPDVMYKYFGNTIKPGSGKTENGVFICTLARYLQVFGDELATAG